MTLKHGDRAGAIWRIDDRRRIVAIAGYGTYAGEDREENRLCFGEKDSTILADGGGELDVDACHSWGAESTVKRIVDEYKRLGFRVMSKEDFRKEPEAVKRVQWRI